MPFEAAKAVAATFCYNIRYALTPVFGVDFVPLCTEPEDPSFGRMVIDREIVRQCIESANELRALHRRTPKVFSLQSPSLKASPNWASKNLRPKPVKSLDMESGYGTDTDRSDRYLSSPQTPFDLGWTTINTRRSAAQPLHRLPPPRELLAGVADTKNKVSPKSSSSEESQKGKRLRADHDDDYDGESTSSQSSIERSTPPKRRKKSMTITKEARAAYMLMRLQMADATLGTVEQRMGRRRASS